MTRRTIQNSSGTPPRDSDGQAKLRVGSTRGLVAPVSNKTTTVTLRLSGVWHDLWQELQSAVPTVSEAELLRQGLALRMALAATDAAGQKPRAYIEFVDESGRAAKEDLEAYVGISPQPKARD